MFDAILSSKALLLTILCVVMPLGQTILITWNKICHPKIPSGQPETGTVHHLRRLKTNYTLLIQGTLPSSTDHKHYNNIHDWLQLGEINMNNVSPDDRESLNPELTAHFGVQRNRRIGRMSVALEGAGEEANLLQYQPANFVVQTPMMRIINHHVEMMKLTARLEQFNYGMKLSKETSLRANRLAWRGAVEQLRTRCDTQQLPKAVTYSAVRRMKDDESWDKDEMGDKITPFNLIIEPWPTIQTQANKYLNSLMCDVWMYWFQIWFSLVFLKFILRTS